MIGESRSSAIQVREILVFKNQDVVVTKWCVLLQGNEGLLYKGREGSMFRGRNTVRHKLRSAAVRRGVVAKELRFEVTSLLAGQGPVEGESVGRESECMQAYKGKKALLV